MRNSILALMMLVWSACDLPEETPHFVDEDKADSQSHSTTEFDLTGTIEFRLPDDYWEVEDQRSALRFAADYAMKGVVEEVEDSVSATLSGAKFFLYSRNMYPETDYEDLERIDANWATFKFRISLVGPKNIPDILTNGWGGNSFVVDMSYYGSGGRKSVKVGIERSANRDAFPKYDVLFADGVYDVGVHFGDDYNEQEYDLQTARWLVNYLKNSGWQSPAGVTGFRSLRINSGPFTKALVIEGKAVEARIHIFHSEMANRDNVEKLGDAMKESFRSRDVVIYAGHAGNGTGFILDYDTEARRYEIDAEDFASLDMRDDYQIFVLDGCATSQSYVGDLMKNPSKTFENVDIVTTVHSAPFQVENTLLYEFVNWLSLADYNGNHNPVTWMSILRGINNAEGMEGVHYGIHGMERDPHINPNGSEGVACTSCTLDADCAGGGNLCVQLDGVGVCGVACTTDDVCGPSSRCARVIGEEEAVGPGIPRQCVPRSNRCEMQ